MTIGCGAFSPVSITNNILMNSQSVTCSTDWSLFSTGSTVLNNDKAGDPKFKNTDFTNPHAPDYYRIGSTSAAVDSADPMSTIQIDIDGVSRPQGATFDIGAAEYKP